ncbi:helix-turn-helix transcriptional regulator [Sagittula salina]|uniref:Helix-turn-helix transcriptional regulator n=1 Tax=Sagittula salina TaxID=2820268 RepID=A0A940MK95_9RHOB|nr:helix-turn-helix transcriptional regulator [Sagittula salina]MBP0483056.1 helix-turn-helix transcriptional regulator [Sagittula salina]
MKSKAPLGLILLIVAQSLCAAFFAADVVADGIEARFPHIVNWHFAVEALAALALIAGVIFEVRALMALLRRKAHLEEQLGLAAGAFHEIVTQRFSDWGLTPSEQDVAHFTLKGLAIPEIATLRGSAEGTVKAHLGGIYRKAGVKGRGAFLALFIEDLMAAPDPADPTGAPDAPATAQA